MNWNRWLGAALVAAPLMMFGCGGGNDTSAVASGSSGAFGIITVDGKQKMYLPLPYGDVTTGNGAIAVVDVGVAGNGTAGANALITTIDLGVSEVPSTTGGDSSVVVAAGIATKKVWLINPHSDQVEKVIDLPDTYGTSSFSGGGGYVTGIAMDSANHRAILSVWNGFALLDTQSGTITGVIQAAPSENFGFDSVHQRIIAPFYECSGAYDGAGNPATFCNDYKDPSGTVITDGLNIIDLASQTVFTYQDSGATNPNAPVDGEPDGAAVNPNTGVVVVASESNENQHVIDLQSGQFDSGAKQVTAAQHVFPNNFARLTGVSVEPGKNLAFFEEEFGATVGVLNLAGATKGNGQVIVGTLPALPDGTTWSNLGDPHGIAVTTGISDGKSVGFVVTSDGAWVARVDLEKFAGFDGSAAPVDATVMAGAVTFLHAVAQ